MTPIVKDMTKALQGMTGRHDLYRAFCDSMEMMALAVSNGCDKAQFDAREARYLEIVKGYNREELGYAGRLLALLTEGMEAGLSDYLGELFMALELGSDARGQFFTPYSLCKLMAELTINDTQIQQAVAERGFVSVQEPSVGAGAMVLAMEEAMRLAGHAGVMHVTCVDVDIRAVHMAYLQLSLAGIPAIVVHGNTLSLEEWGHWYTPVHIWQGWSYRLRRRNVVERAEPMASAAVPVIAAPAEQLDLFGATA